MWSRKTFSCAQVEKETKIDKSKGLQKKNQTAGETL